MNINRQVNPDDSNKTSIRNDTDYENDLEIEFYSMFKGIWVDRRVLYKIVSVFILIGILISIFTPNEYTVTVKILPEVQGQQSSISRFGGLAQQFGLLTNQAQSFENLSVMIYPEILNSTIFLHNVISKKVYLSEISDSISVQEYFGNYYKDNHIRKYTLGLPFQILRIFRSTNSISRTEIQKQQSYITIVPSEMAAISRLRQNITNERDMVTGVMTIQYRSQSPEISAQLGVIVTDLFVKFLSDYRTNKARQNLEFVTQRYLEAEKRFTDHQEKLASYRDQNKGNLTAVARTELQNLESQYNLIFNVYSGLAEQLESAQIKLQTDTPLINIIQESIYPNSNSGPNRLYLVIVYTMIGVFLAIGFILIKPLLIKFKEVVFSE